MNFEIRFAPESGTSYTAIVKQLHERWGEKVVLQFEAKVKKYVKIIATNPYLYTVIHDNMQLRKCVLHKNCSLLYRVYKKEVLIVAFWDNRQEPIF